jgi:3-oxoacyl-[acyl-carrier protein] reductase
MDQLKFERKVPSVWLVGGSGKLGISIAERLLSHFNVVNLSRRATKPNSERFFNLSVDLSDVSFVQALIKELLNEDSPRAVVFCQRYRPSVGSENVDVMLGMNTEIVSSQLIIQELINTGRKHKCSVVVISSVNGAFVSKQLPFWYHWLKSSQIALVKYYSVKHGDLELNVNCLAAGSFLKDDFSVYPDHLQSQLSELGRSSPMKKNTSVHDIAAAVEFLISDQAIMINGQVISIDGGMTNILQETLI